MEGIAETLDKCKAQARAKDGNKCRISNCSRRGKYFVIFDVMDFLNHYPNGFIATYCSYHTKWWLQEAYPGRSYAAVIGRANV